MVTLATDPARLAALVAGEKRYASLSFQCQKNLDHVWRYAESMGCAECKDLMNDVARVKRGKASKPTARKIVEDHCDDRLPMIGSDFDQGVNERRLIKTTGKFLKALYAEKLQAIRSGVALQ